MTQGNRVRHTFRLPPALSRQLADFAGRRRVSQASVVEAALASFLSPDGSERMEAAFSRRLDRLSRQMDKLDYHLEVGNEAFALYLRRWLAVTATSQADDTPAARADVEKRFSHFIDALARRVEGGHRLSNEIVRAQPENDGRGAEH